MIQLERLASGSLRQRASVADLAGHEWVIASPGTPLRARWESLFAGHPQPPTPVESGSVMIIRGLLLNSDLLSLLSPDQVALELGDHAAKGDNRPDKRTRTYWLI